MMSPKQCHSKPCPGPSRPNPQDATRGSHAVGWKCWGPWRPHRQWICLTNSSFLIGFSPSYGKTHGSYVDFPAKNTQHWGCFSAVQPGILRQMVALLPVLRHDQPAPVPGTKRLREEHQNQNIAELFQSFHCYLSNTLHVQPVKAHLHPTSA